MNTATPAHPANNFDFVRIVAATLVLYNHQYALSGQMEPSFFGLHSFGGFAVLIFFAISGYLVTQSWYSDPNILRFALRRLLRIWPALAVVVTLTALVLGPVVSSLPAADYYAHGGTWQYFLNLRFIAVYILPEAFAKNPYPLGVNGSIWTIPIEVLCYLVLAVCGLAGLLKKKTIWLAAIVIYLAWYLAQSSPDLYHSIHQKREMGAYFLSGSALYVLREYWQKRPWTWLAALALLAGGLLLAKMRYTALLAFMPYAVISLGTASTPFIRRFGRYGDFSYGIYLFAFPVQQTVIMCLYPEYGFWSAMMLSMAITAGLAFLSWHLVERRALVYKPRRNEPVIKYLCRSWHQIKIIIARHTWIIPVGTCIYGYKYILARFHNPVMFDPQYTYLPAAKSLIEQGWSFFASPASYRVAPLTYLWPALWGADPSSIRIAHMGIWTACVCLLWHTCKNLAGATAAVISMVLLLLTPQLLLYFPSEMSEPLYLLGFFGWIHAMSALFLDNPHKHFYTWQAGIALAIMLLTRPVFQLMAPAALVGCLAFIVLRQRIPLSLAPRLSDIYVRPVAWSLFIGLVPLALFIFKNGVIFDFWALGTGAGTGLYLGLHPLFQGTEPGFLGFDYDINALILNIAPGKDHLDLEGDRIARAAALWQLGSMSASESLLFFGQKLWWWLAHQPMEIKRFGSILRNVRVFELLTITWAALMLIRHFMRRDKNLQYDSKAISFAVMLLLLVAAMLVQFLPILHNARYSAAFFDPILIVIASLALTWIISPITPVSSSPASLAAHCALTFASTKKALPIFVLLFMTAGVATFARKIETIAVRPALTGHTRTRFEIHDTRYVTVLGARADGPNEWITTDNPAVLYVSISESMIESISNPPPLNALWRTSLSIITPDSQKCHYIDVGYLTDRGIFMQPDIKFPLRLQIDSGPGEKILLTHANQQMRPKESGKYQLQFLCPVGTKIHWNSTSLLESTQIFEAAKNIQYPSPKKWKEPSTP